MKKTKLFVQIPCFNEEKTLPLVIADIPRKIEGIDEIYVLIIDDGCEDKTVDVAKRLGADYILRNHRRLGLAQSFSRGLEASVFLGADIIVNTDGDNQYSGTGIAELVKPILERRADIVIGCRDIDGNKDFHWSKKFFQKLGSNIVRRLSGTNVSDTTSGFRAISRLATMKFFTLSNFSYTLEMLIQAGQMGMRIKSTRVQVNEKLRESRLMKSNYHFITQQLKTLLKVYLFYYPMRFFGYLFSIAFIISILLSMRIFYFLLLINPGQLKFKTGSGVLLLFTTIIGALFIVAGLLFTFLSGLRFLIFDIRSRVRNLEIQQGILPSDFDIITAVQFFQWSKINK